jgi:glucosamine 6-phosphate synthetase-like amidotransferase/phosphosugar isomerase protein
MAVATNCESMSRILRHNDRAVAARAEHVIEVPPAVELLAPLVTVVPLPLLAYHVALRRGCDVDQPRNLAKSVRARGPTNRKWGHIPSQKLRVRGGSD